MLQDHTHKDKPRITTKMMSFYIGIPLLYCVGCYQCVCSGPCLATHRDIYICHNAWCHFHKPPLAPPAAIDQGQAQPAAASTNDAPETRAITASITQNAGDGGMQATLATNPGDSNVIRREAIAREYRQVGPGPNPPSGSGPTAHMASAADTLGPNADVQQSSKSPARFSIEEYEAQAQLLERFQPLHNGEQPVPREGSGQEPARRPRIQIIWE